MQNSVWPLGLFVLSFKCANGTSGKVTGYQNLSAAVLYHLSLFCVWELLLYIDFIKVLFFQEANTIITSPSSKMDRYRTETGILKVYNDLSSLSQMDCHLCWFNATPLCHSIRLITRCFYRTFGYPWNLVPRGPRKCPQLELFFSEYLSL